MPWINLPVVVFFFLYKWNHAACTFLYLGSFNIVYGESDVLFHVVIVHSCALSLSRVS